MAHFPAYIFAMAAAIYSGKANQIRQISTCAQFEAIRNFPSGEFSLSRDIDCKNQLHKPFHFSGKLYGNFKTVSNIIIRQPSGNGVGIFSRISPDFQGEAPILERLRFKNISVIGKDTVGILAGMISNAKLDNIEIQGSVQGRDFLGAVAGVLDKYCFVKSIRLKSKIRGNDCIGGLACSSKFSVISYAYSNSEISGSNGIGGIISELSNTSLQFVGSSGQINGNDTVGGIAAILDGNVDQIVVPKYLQKFVFDELESLDQLVPPYEEWIDHRTTTKLPSKFNALNGWFFSASDTLRIPSSIYQANASVEINANSFVGGFVGVTIENPLGIAMSSSSAFINARQSVGSISGSGTFSTVNQAIALSGMCPNCNSGSPVFGSGSGSITDVFIPNHFSPSEILSSLYDSVRLDREISHPSFYFNWLPKSDTDFITGYRWDSDRKANLISIIPITRNSYDKPAYDFDRLVISKNVKIDRHAPPGSPPIFKTLPIFKSLTDTIDLKQHIWSWENGSSITFYGDTSCLISQKNLLIRRKCESPGGVNSFFCIRTERWTGSCFSSSILFE